MRTSMEPLTYKHGVDIFYYGHVHAYERTHPVYDYTIDPCGAVHITIGDGGNSEGLSFLASNKMSPGRPLPHVGMDLCLLHCEFPVKSCSLVLLLPIARSSTSQAVVMCSVNRCPLLRSICFLGAFDLPSGSMSGRVTSL